ncbi:hypothetical protein Q9L58_002841 [Maublancomyces gigas]|uniref:Uncharacterized protein n=1 Tax=Discina gigas TaxID=1032678 RepID=A0ABR3GQH2_9PEZI
MTEDDDDDDEDDDEDEVDSLDVRLVGDVAPDEEAEDEEEGDPPGLLGMQMAEDMDWSLNLKGLQGDPGLGGGCPVLIAVVLGGWWRRCSGGGVVIVDLSRRCG